MVLCSLTSPTTPRTDFSPQVASCLDTGTRLPTAPSSSYNPASLAWLPARNVTLKWTSMSLTLTVAIF